MTSLNQLGTWEHWVPTGVSNPTALAPVTPQRCKASAIIYPAIPELENINQAKLWNPGVSKGAWASAQLWEMSQSSSLTRPLTHDWIQAAQLCREEKLTLGQVTALSTDHVKDSVRTASSVVHDFSPLHLSQRLASSKRKKNVNGYLKAVRLRFPPQ